MATQNLTGLRATGGHRTLRFGLLSVDVGLVPLLDGQKRVKGSLIAPNGSSVQQRYIDADGTLYERSDLHTGYKVNGGVVELTDSDLDALKLDGDDSVELVSRVADSDVPAEYIEKTALVFPTDTASGERYKLLADLLRTKGWALIGKAVDHGTTKAFAIRWSDTTETLVAHTLNYDANVRWGNVEKVRQTLDHLPEPSNEMMDLAEQMFAALPEGYDFASLEDEYGIALEQAVQAKAQGITPAPRETVPQSIGGGDLMEALKRSVEASNADKPKAKPKAKAKSTKGKNGVAA